MPSMATVASFAMITARISGGTNKFQVTFLAEF